VRAVQALREEVSSKREAPVAVAYFFGVSLVAILEHLDFQIFH
jgi:hypothetical protein